MKINFLTIRGVSYAYVDYGEGIPWVFIHGFPFDHRMWEPQIEAIGQRARAIAPDLRGFGQSEATADKTTMAEFADDLADLLDALAIRQPAVLCGLSMGGYIALEFWCRHKERLAGLVLCDTRAAPDTPEAARGRHETAQRVLEEGPAFLADSMLPRLLAPQTTQNHPELLERLREQIAQMPRQGVAAAALGMAERRDMQPILPQITCPTLVLVGSEDVTSPPGEMRSIARAIPGAQFVEIPEAGHLAPLEQPALVASAFLDFLARLPNTPSA